MINSPQKYTRVELCNYEFINFIKKMHTYHYFQLTRKAFKSKHQKILNDKKSF